ncbi:alcohol dehydrogenase catalytic domain-containing protein [Acinetobacter sp. TSRC1-2]|uniref:alcohol dehydrogenase catalytic domain-containing protein n=1 Tax=unclassified Acinetobacter TaxID=196816 RepID=UPI003CF43B58
MYENQSCTCKRKNYPLVIEEIEIDEPREDEVLIRIVASGVCHTDADSIKGNGAPFSAVLGYEDSGVIERVGSSVTNLKYV